LIWCETKRNSKDEKLFDYVTAIPLREISTISADQRDEKENAFRLVMENETWTLTAQTPKERNLWMNDLSSLVCYYCCDGIDVTQILELEKNRRESISLSSPPVLK
jgi:hypothetical protein